MQNMALLDRLAGYVVRPIEAIALALGNAFVDVTMAFSEAMVYDPDGTRGPLLSRWIAARARRRHDPGWKDMS